MVMVGVEPSGALGLKSGKKSVTGVSRPNLPSSIIRIAAAVTMGLDIEASRKIASSVIGLPCSRLARP